MDSFLGVGVFLLELLYFGIDAIPDSYGSFESLQIIIFSLYPQIQIRKAVLLLKQLLKGLLEEGIVGIVENLLVDVNITVLQQIVLLVVSKQFRQLLVFAQVLLFLLRHHVEICLQLIQEGLDLFNKGLEISYDPVCLSNLSLIVVTLLDLQSRGEALEYLLRREGRHLGKLLANISMLSPEEDLTLLAVYYKVPHRQLTQKSLKEKPSFSQVCFVLALIGYS